MGAEAQDVEDQRIEGVERAIDEVTEDRVVGAQRAQRAVDQLGRECRVASLEPATRKQPGQHQVGVGVLLTNGAQRVERDNAHRVGRDPRRHAGRRPVGWPSREPIGGLKAGAARPGDRGHRGLPLRLNRRQHDRCRRRADEHRLDPVAHDHDGAGPELRGCPASSQAAPGPSLRRRPRNVVQAPGAGVQARIKPVDVHGRGRPVELGIGRRDLRSQAHAVRASEVLPRACRRRVRRGSPRAGPHRRSTAGRAVRRRCRAAGSPRSGRRGSGPVSSPASSSKVVAPVMSSPCRIACCTGAAPRQAGSSEKCRLIQPRRGISKADGGTSAPYATTATQSGARVAQPLQELRVGRLGRLQHLDAGLVARDGRPGCRWRPCRDRPRRQGE